jgi:hypothetical protein
MEQSTETLRSVGGRGLQGSGPRSRTFGPGRLCSESGCGTCLSIYNDGLFCARHQAKVAPRMRGKKRAIAPRREEGSHKAERPLT